IAYLLLYVDAIILTSSSTTFLQRRTSIRLSQSTYVEEILERAYVQQLTHARFSLISSLSYVVLQIVGALQYFTFTCLDLSYDVQQLHISFIAQLTAYTDGDWASCHVTSHSTSGYYIVLNITVLLMLLLRQLR
ncbi:ribonuclease H-like domain-containing protein, partial [Tanacetum coccineum]